MNTNATSALGSLVVGLCFVVPVEDVRAAVIGFAKIAESDQLWRVLLRSCGIAEGHAADFIKQAIDVEKKGSS